MTARPPIDISPEHWRIVRSILKKHVPHVDVWAFGSRARGTARKYSDLDLAVITAYPLDTSVRLALVDDFAGSDLPFKVDVVDWATISESFRAIVLQQQVPVQKGESSR